MNDATPDFAEEHAGRLEKPVGWQEIPADAPVMEEFIRRIFGPYAAGIGAADITVRLWVKRSPCHVGLLILRIAIDDGWPVFALMRDEAVQRIDGSEGDLYAVNLHRRPALGTVDEARAYLRLYLDISRGDKGWFLVEEPVDLIWQEETIAAEARAAVEAHLQPISIGEPDAHGRRACTAMVQAKGRILLRKLILWPDGLVITRGEEPVCAEPLLALPPPLRPFMSLFSEVLAGIVPEEMAQEDRHEANAEAPAESAAHPAAPPRKLADVFKLVAGILLKEAVRTGFRPRGRKVAKPGEAFAEYLRVYRPTIAIETPYGELRQDFAEIIAEICGLPLNRALQSAAAPPQRVMLSDPSVMLLTEASFGQMSEGAAPDTALALEPIVHGPHIGLFVVGRIAALDQSARDVIDLRLTVGRLSEDQFWECARALFGSKARRRDGMQDWMRYVLPRDIARAATATSEIGPFLAELQDTVSRRLAHYTEAGGPTLADLHGMGEARFRMEELATDIAAALRGDIDWDKVDRGYLLVGPPGTGKTTLVRALARECGIRFVLASASVWQEGTSLGPHIQNIRASFREARLYAPAILFIDELDSIGRRGHVEERNSQYQTVVINTLLEEMQGFQGREGVIVIGATNNPEEIDPALRRPGRLDRIVELGYPNVAALSEIYAYYLAKAAAEGFSADGVDVAQLARMTFGRTGSHVELYVRGAIRRARRAGRQRLTDADLQAEITNRPPDGLQVMLAPDAMRRVAVHEAGHALTMISGPRGAAGLTWISITPRANGSLGFVAQMPDESVFSTHEELEESIRVILGGRAAEELVFGRAAITTGAGGSEGSDLAIASRLALRMLTQFGFSEASGLLWLDWQSDGKPRAMTAEAIRNLPLGDEILHEARRTLDRLYGETLERLRAHQTALMRVVDLLIARQDVPPEEVAAAMAEGGD
ncbi:AAA family ATPase [Acidisoma sp. C75]